MASTRTFVTRSTEEDVPGESGASQPREPVIQDILSSQPTGGLLPIICFKDYPEQRKMAEPG